MPELTGYRADSTDQAELEKLVEVLSDSERLLDETIGAALAETDVDRAISDVLERLGTQVGARRVILCEYDFGRNRVTCTYEWSAHDVERLAGAALANFNAKPFNDAWRDSFNEWGVAKASAGEGLDLCGAEHVVAGARVCRGPSRGVRRGHRRVGRHAGRLRGADAAEPRLRRCAAAQEKLRQRQGPVESTRLGNGRAERGLSVCPGTASRQVRAARAR